MRVAALTLLLLGLPALGRAQDIRLIRGSVTDTSGSPVAGAVIAVAGGPRTVAAVSGAGGRFVLRPAGAANLVAARIGFAPETLAVRDSLTFVLRPAPVRFEPIVVAADRSSSAASASYLTQLDAALRPRESSQELLRLTPGLVIAQHAGGGKAEQIFLRGFDADHGTDVAVSVDGTPVNMVSHAHGQGYADLHWLMPEVVADVEVRKGPYDAADGDFATAGAVSFSTRDRLGIDRPWLEARGGSFGTAHATLLAPFGREAGRTGGFVAGAFHRSDGPFERPQDYRRYNAFGKLTAPLGAAELVVSASGFSAGWDASGQVPARAVAARSITRFGAIDPTEGGHTERQEASVTLRSAAGGTGRWDVRAFALRYQLKLYSNFTFYLNDTVNGDGIAQFDDRTATGLRATWARPNTVLGRPGSWDAGAGTRADWADVRLSHQRARSLLESRIDDRVRQASVYGWLRQSLDVTDRLRVDLALRGDLLRFSVTDKLAGVDSTLPHASGRRWQGIVNPRVNAAFRLASGTTLYANAAGGFHSNDARDAILAGATGRILPRALGAETGARHTWSGGSVSAALWLLDLESELVYVGDEGTTEPSGRTRRTGLDLGGRLRLTPWLWADADLNLARGRLRDEPAGANRVPLAPGRVATAGLTAAGAGSLGGGLRIRHVAARPANETGTITASGYTLTEAFASWRVAHAEVRLAVDNIFGAPWNEAQFATRSRLPGESPAGVEELHFTPGAPRGAQLAITWRF